MKLNYTVLYLLLLAFISCGKISPKGEIVAKDIPVEKFTTLDLKGNFRVFFVRSTENFVNVETHENIANNLKINVHNNTLSISEKRATEHIDFYNITIYAKQEVEKIHLSEQVELNVSGEIKTDDFTLNLQNNAKFIGALHTERTAIEMADLSRANFLGKTKNATLKIKDTANVIAPYWAVNVFDLDTKNGAYTEINVADTLKGNLQNTSKLVYYGMPIATFKAEKSVKVEKSEKP